MSSCKRSKKRSGLEGEARKGCATTSAVPVVYVEGVKGGKGLLVGGGRRLRMRIESTAVQHRHAAFAFNRLEIGELFLEVSR